MKTFDAGLLAHVAGGRTTLAHALRITRTDGQVYAFTTHDEDSVVAGRVYSSNPGLNVTDIVTTAGTSVGTLELRTLNDSTVFNMSDIFNGLWRNAAFLLMRYSWEDPSIGVENLLAGHIGEVTVRDAEIVAELRDLRQYLQQPVGDSSSRTCRARLGDARCTKNLTSFTYSGTITSVTSTEVFRDSARAEAAEWFSDGEIEFTSGDNVGVRRKVHGFSSGTFTVAVPYYAPVQIGDTYTAIAGCRKRLSEDCKDKFNNVVNFVGEPHRKGLNDLMKKASS